MWIHCGYRRQVEQIEALNLTLTVVAATPNPSLNPRLATAGVVSPARATRTIVAVRAYNTCLRSRG